MKLMYVILPIVLFLSGAILQAQSLKEKMQQEKKVYVKPIAKPAPSIIQPLSKQKKINLTVLVYVQNDSVFIQESLKSILTQKQIRKNYDPAIICLLDHVNDETLTEIEKLNNPKIQIRQFSEPTGKLNCLYQTIHAIHDQNIIVLVDGKDRLENDNVLKKLYKEYTTNDTWITFGAAVGEPKGSNIGIRNGTIPAAITDSGNYRKIFPYMPTNSFYAWLFKRINKEDLIDPNTDDFYEYAPECYYIWPMVEMAAQHTKIFTEKTYVLNCSDPVASLTKDYHLRRACNSQIGRELPVYQPLS